MTESNFIRQSQVVTTFGPGAMVDLPNYSVIIGGLNQWTKVGRQQVHEPRLVAKLAAALGIQQLQLFAPPAVDETELRRPTGNRRRVTRFVAGRVFPT